MESGELIEWKEPAYRQWARAPGMAGEPKLTQHWCSSSAMSQKHLVAGSNKGALARPSLACGQQQGVGPGNQWSGHKVLKRGPQILPGVGWGKDGKPVRERRWETHKVKESLLGSHLRNWKEWDYGWGMGQLKHSFQRAGSVWARCLEPWHSCPPGVELVQGKTKLWSRC